MKRFLAIALALLLAGAAWGADTWFGRCNATTGADPGGSSGKTWGGKIGWLDAGYVCPGTGAQDVSTLGFMTWYFDPTVYARMGIYDSVGDIVVESSAAKYGSTGGETWLDWAAGSSELTWHKGTTLTGGATYFIAIASQSGSSVFGISVTDGDTRQEFADYTAGMPATLPSAGDMAVEPNTHVLVVPAGATTYTVTYDANGGTGSQTDASSPYAESATVTVLGVGTIARTGYTFIGWDTASNYTGTRREPADTFAMPASNVTLYAIWATVSGTTKTSPTARYADVSDTLALCVTDDTLEFPTASSATWSTVLNVAVAITIDGNGSTLTAGAVMANGFFRIQNLTTADLMRITDFTFNNNNTSGGAAIGFYNLALTSLRIDHNTFHHGTRTMEVVGAMGVIDNNYFYNCDSMLLGSAGTRAQADASWVSLAAGTANALFIEDNHFILDANWTGGSSNGNMIDAYQGGKYVIRYNTFDSSAIPAGFTGTVWVIGLHGSAKGGASVAYWEADSGARRGPSVVEIYNNTLTGKQIGAGIIARGGAWLVHDNVLSSTYSTSASMYEEEQYAAEWDPNRTAWPAEDQVHNSFFWGNTFNGSADSDASIVVQGGSGDYIQKNRDYFLHRPATLDEGMTLGIETFTAANGASDTYPTNGVVYNTDGTMVFTPDVENAYYGYTPYTYPHPLTGVTAYALAYSANGGTGTVVDASSPYEEAATVTVLHPTDDGDIARVGYVFVEWDTAADGSGTAYAPDATFAMPAAARTLYAQWTVNTYTLTYDGNTADSGTPPTDASSPYDYAEQVTTLGNTGTLVKAGYVFAGWNTQADGGGTTRGVGSTWAMGAGNVTLYARWAVAVVGGNRTASFAIATGMFGLSCLLIGFALGLAWAHHRQQAAVALTRAEVLADLADPERAKTRAELDYWLTHPGDKPEDGGA